MATVRFLSSGVDVTIRCDVQEGERRTVLSIARENGVPLPFRCQVGEYTACLVHVDTQSIGCRSIVRPSEKELALLRDTYILNEHDIEDAEKRGVSPDARLACQYELADEEITVFFQTPSE